MHWNRSALRPSLHESLRIRGAYRWSWIICHCAKITNTDKWCLEWCLDRHGFS